jgi:formate dehydrogenase iron-sulfur subunit
MAKVIYMDLNRCINCRSCEVACEREHGGYSNMFVQVIDEQYAMPLNCRHCEESFCTEVCPTQAVHRETEDAVIVTPMKCIGCGLCTIACPFGAVWQDRLNKIARKCDLCIHRTQISLEPACVATCSARALSFGEFDVLLETARRKEAPSVVNRSAGSVGTIVTLPSWIDGLSPLARAESTQSNNR